MMKSLWGFKMKKCVKSLVLLIICMKLTSKCIGFYQYKKLDRLYTDLELMELSDSLDDNRTMNEIVSRLLNDRGYVYDYINENWEKI